MTTLDEFCKSFSKQISGRQKFALIEQLKREEFADAFNPHTHTGWELRLRPDNGWDVIPPETLHSQRHCIYSLEVDVHRVILTYWGGGLLLNRMISSELANYHQAPELFFLLQRSRGNVLLASHLLSAALHSLLEVLQRLALQPEERPGLNLADKAMIYLQHSYYRASLSLDEVAQVFGTSPQNLNRVMRLAEMPSFHEFLLQFRMERAEKFLQTGRYTVKEVARMTGWNSPFYFSNCFHKYFGCPPSLFRAKARSEGADKPENLYPNSISR